jgi:hypothetical protein
MVETLVCKLSDGSENKTLYGRSSRSQHFGGADVGRRQSHFKALDVGILSLGDSGD